MQFSHRNRLERSLEENSFRRALSTIPDYDAETASSHYFASPPHHSTEEFSCGLGPISIPAPKVSSISDPTNSTNSTGRAVTISTRSSSSHVYYGDGDCYDSDSKDHYFEHGIAIDESLKSYYGSRSKAISAVESVVAFSSSVYEYQMNVHLVIGQVLVAGDSNADDDVFTTCKSGTSATLSAWSSFLKTLPDSLQQGSWHFMTNCYPLVANGQSQTVGTANVGTAGCRYGTYGWNGAVSQRIDLFWSVYAHEQGHNFGATHSFENGVGTTGGIMDYGNPYIDGRPLFREERITQMCSRFSYMVSSECEFFYSKSSKDTTLSTVGSLSSDEETCDLSKSECTGSSNYCSWDSTNSACTFEAMYSMGSGTACRSGKKSKSSFYTTETASDIYECMSACASAGSSCTGVQYNSGSSECQLWTAEIDSVGSAASTSTCVSMSIDSTPVSLEGTCSSLSESDCTGSCSWSTVRAACTNKEFFKLGEQCTFNGNALNSYSSVVKKVKTLDSCMELCDDGCFAVEYEDDANKCRLWNKKIPTSAKSNDSRACYVKVDI
eukprot:CAMPEP_0171530634 /NCGR_PEP_ID=MMETSP0959-20130129/13238_1 /TAXON_ID=87120 /ORGANISM="Aurantiochytrium limacinum, Strain ATCCMYA-1381" /LENGTH=551 /DNA_ID=CAMNT_0012073551 /DNA_START=9 /DNA_END=1663 /DNA_ORIENTATION=-